MKLHTSLFSTNSTNDQQLELETILLKHGYNRSLMRAAGEYDRSLKGGTILNMPKGKRVFLDTLNSVSTWLMGMVEAELTKRNGRKSKFYLELVEPYMTKYLKDQQRITKYKNQEAKYENPVDLLGYFLTAELTRAMVIESRMTTELSRRAVNSYTMSYNNHKEATNEELVAMIQLVRSYVGSDYNKFFLETTTPAGVTISLKEEFASLHVTKEELLSTVPNDRSPYKPMLVEPLPHNNLISTEGGYLELESPLLKNPEFDIIRQMEFNSTSHPQWFNDINAMQSTAWQVNTPFLNWLKGSNCPQLTKYFNTDVATLQIETTKQVTLLEREVKKHSKLVQRARYESSQTTVETRKAEIKVEVSNAMDAIELLEIQIAELRSQVGKVRGWEETVNDAEFYSNYDKFFHPLFCDNRGRVYTYNNSLSFQGSPLAKSLVQTYNKERMDKNALLGVKELLGGMFEGYSKKTKEVRIKLVNKHMKDIYSVIECKDFSLLSKLDEDELLQALVLMFELYNHYHNRKYKTGVLAYIDSTSSAIQIQALAQKCIKAASLTNLLPVEGEDLPDAYKAVAANCQSLVQEISAQTDEELYATMIVYYMDNAPEKLEYTGVQIPE